MNIVLRYLLVFILILPAAGAAERYFNATVIPAIDLLQENALAAVRSNDPKQLGNALLMLVLTRDELSSPPALTEERRSFLQNIAVSLGLTTKDAIRRFHDFLAWSKNQAPEKQRWIPETRAALVRFEQHIAEADPLAEWLPAWVDTIPLLPEAAVDSGTVLPPAWTWRGHAVAKELAETTGATPEWHANALREYRNNALAAWRGGAAKLWDGIPANIPDAEIPARLREIAEGKDPASLFARSAAGHLLPMFDTENAGSAENAPPEITWLRHSLQQEPPPAAIKNDAAAVAAATRAAEERTAALNAAAGTPAPLWPTLSPLAADVYQRHLLARQTSLKLDATWQRTVYTPSRFSPENPEESRARLVAFLTGPAHGFWTWNASGNIDNAHRYGVPFTLSQEFLSYCNALLAQAQNPAPAELPLRFTITSVTAAGENVIERPTAVHFRLGKEHITYHNYPASADWTWTPETTEAEIQLVFPSHTATKRFRTPAELKQFATYFGEGRCVLTPEDFDADSAPILHRLGVEEIILAAALGNLETLLPQLNRVPLPPLPMRIISKRGENQK